MTDTEMDNTRDVRREVSRFLRSRQIKQPIRPNNTKKFFSGLDGFGDFATLVKSKKDRVRKLSVVGIASSSHEEMGCEVSDREDNFGSRSPPTSVCTSKRLKFFHDCNGVDHASVPRKLRSAMKKRGQESISPPLLDSKKLNHTNDKVEHWKKDDPKKPKLNVKQGGSEWSPRESVSGPITKDEEEVAETLFALAGMFPDDEATDKSKLGESSDAKGSLIPAFEGSMVSKELNSICPSRKADTTVEPSIKAEELSDQTMKMNSLNDPSVKGLSELPDSKQYKLETYSSTPPVNHQIFPFSSKNEKTLCNSLHFSFASELNLDRGFEQPRKLETSLPERSPELAPGLPTSLASQLGQHSIKEGKKNGLALWPGLSTTASGSPGPTILQSSTSKIPAWLDTAPSASSRPLFESSFSNDKVTERTGHKKMLKRCAAHVYISHLIHALQTPDRADRPLQPDHLKSSQGPKQETVQRVASSFDGVRNGVVSTPNVGNCSSPEFFPNEVRSVLHHKNLHQDSYSSHAQSLDFFSQSSNNGTQRCHKGLEAMSRFHVPSLNPSVHNHSQLPVTMSQTRYSSSAYPDRLSSATQQVQLQQPPHYVGTSFSNTDPTNQRQQLRYQQQQQIWAAQYRAASMSTTVLENWQNGRQDPPTVIQATSTPSVEVVGSKYIPILQQQQHQQRFMAISPSSVRIKRQEHHHIAAYEEAGGGLRPPLQLQLLCHERL